MDVKDIKSINVELAAITWTAYESRKILHILQVLYPFGQHKETSRDGLHRIPTCWTAWTATWTASPSTLHAWTALGQQHLQHLDTLGSTLTSYWTAPPRQTAPARDSSCWTATCTTCSTSTLDSTLQHQQLYTPLQQLSPRTGQQQHSSALGQHAWQHLQGTAVAGQQPAAPSAPGQQQHSAAPAAPMDSSSCTSSNSQRPAPNCPRQGQHTQQTHTRTSRFFLFLVSC
jgi:hypothetical protein